MTTDIKKGRDRTLYPASPVPAVAVMVRRGDAVLMIKRGKEPKKGTWTVPGGSIEPGEAIFQAAKREVMEETGLSVQPLEAFTAVDAIYHDGRGRLRFHYVIIYIEAAYLGGEAVAGDDATEACWVNFENISKGFRDAEPGTLQIIKKRLGL